MQVRSLPFFMVVLALPKPESLIKNEGYEDHVVPAENPVLAADLWDRATADSAAKALAKKLKRPTVVIQCKQVAEFAAKQEAEIEIEF